MSAADLDLRTSALLSFQRALLGMVTADLRAVEVEIEDGRIDARFAYDVADLTDDQRETVEEIETLVLADMADDVTVCCRAQAVPSPLTVGRVGKATYCFLRREAVTDT